MKRIDERDIIFSRVNYQNGYSNYKDYYSRNPDKKSIDDSLRSRPNICEEGSMTYNEVNSKMASSAFEFLGDIMHLCEAKVASEKVTSNKNIITKRIKGFAKHYGACVVGITELKDYHKYTHRGRREDHYGEEINLDHKYAIVFGYEMDKSMINRSPMIPEVIETTKAYVGVSIIGMMLTYFIGSLGYESRNHMDGNYLVIPALVAKDAGLGDIGRNTILTTKDYGSMLRLGVVTTDLELNIDEPVDFGLEDFCNMCKKCSFTCPSQSLSNDFKIGPTGEYNWKIDVESCYAKWRYLGTDCGMCISACPFSQDLDTIKNNDSFKDNPHLIKEALEEYKRKYKNRPFVPGNPDWLR
ncbi:4Fe-4S dicluster domain-containing protein [Romboutsia sp.]|uniref:4Fe-4S dicluster domain-containing protein n=1 Tax=Romboutsia sp. TaxID=1965302 RepID=UPI003F392668